jgi:hypothetical protein
MPRLVSSTVLFLAVLAAAALLAAGGCATNGNESEMPWNTPQTWEGVPGIPGFGGAGGY